MLSRKILYQKIDLNNSILPEWVLEIVYHLANIPLKQCFSAEKKVHGTEKICPI